MSPVLFKTKTLKMSSSNCYQSQFTHIFCANIVWLPLWFNFWQLSSLEKAALEVS
jgi:hypothetical protein